MAGLSVSRQEQPQGTQKGTQRSQIFHQDEEREWINHKEHIEHTEHIDRIQSPRPNQPQRLGQSAVITWIYESRIYVVFVIFVAVRPFVVSLAPRSIPSMWSLWLLRLRAWLYSPPNPQRPCKWTTASSQGAVQFPTGGDGDP